MPGIKTPEFIDNPVVKGREAHYTTITINVPAIMESWRQSLYSFEWLLPGGQIRTLGELPASEQPKRKLVEEALQNGSILEKPILGIGLLDNVEIGSGRAVFLTLASYGCTSLPVHIPKSSMREFEAFKA